jgi:acetyl esterase/lipase
VVNFHGGGFTIGKATDDARWAKAVVEEVDAVFVSIEYRLAPEHPFPTSVEDGADALLYLMEHAQDLGLDRRRIAISGFSAGGNLAFTVPIRLHAELKSRPGVDEKPNSGDGGAGCKVVAIVSWYPSTDFATNTRLERRLSNLYPPQNVSMSDPYLSPGVAPASLLKSLPDEVIIYTCEWDELLVEAERFRDRLVQELGKKVTYRRVDGVAHAWDKSPNFLLAKPLREEVYAEACSHLKRVFDKCLQ